MHEAPAPGASKIPLPVAGGAGGGFRTNEPLNVLPLIMPVLTSPGADTSTWIPTPRLDSMEKSLLEMSILAKTPLPVIQSFGSWLRLLEMPSKLLWSTWSLECTWPLGRSM